MHVSHKERTGGSDLATLITKARKTRGWTQDELADRAGVSRWTVMRWENGSVEGKPGHLAAVADALGIAPVEAFRAIGWLTEDQAPKPARSTTPDFEQVQALAAALLAEYDDDNTPDERRIAIRTLLNALVAQRQNRPEGPTSTRGRTSA